MWRFIGVVAGFVRDGGLHACAIMRSHSSLLQGTQASPVPHPLLYASTVCPQPFMIRIRQGYAAQEKSEASIGNPLRVAAEPMASTQYSTQLSANLCAIRANEQRGYRLDTLSLRAAVWETPTQLKTKAKTT